MKNAGIVLVLWMAFLLLCSCASDAGGKPVARPAESTSAGSGFAAEAPDSAPNAEASDSDAPAVDQPASDAPILDAPAADTPDADASAVDAPVSDSPAADESVSDVPAAEAPLAFLDVIPGEGNKEDSAPYIVLTKFLPRDEPYLAFTSDWRCDIDAENTYYNVHNWYNADDAAYNGIKPGSGYTGFQNVNGGHLAILSMWAVPGCEPVVEYAMEGSRIEPFGGEGEGTKVLIPYDWQVGQWYTNCIQTRNEDGKTYYDLFVRPEDGDWELLAMISIDTPNLGMSWDCSFLEDFIYNGLERADSFRNITATLSDGTGTAPERVFLDVYNNKMFEIANQSLNGSYSAADGVISLYARKENIADRCMFPAQLDAG